MTGTYRRELDYRQTEGGGVRVRPLWNRRSHNLTVEVVDRGLERVLAVRDPSVARNAFLHPLAYMRWRARR
ncbi:MAG TPA: hypothetical protein VNY35_02005 [Solirubrobacteraceae bacterium]|nr:hypothetical protein [Solirubrobacteraceae bacterium]